MERLRQTVEKTTHSREPPVERTNYMCVYNVRTPTHPHTHTHIAFCSTARRRFVMSRPGSRCTAQPPSIVHGRKLVEMGVLFFGVGTLLGVDGKSQRLSRKLPFEALAVAPCSASPRVRGAPRPDTVRYIRNITETTANCSQS